MPIQLVGHSANGTLNWLIVFKVLTLHLIAFEPSKHGLSDHCPALVSYLWACVRKFSYPVNCFTRARSSLFRTGGTFPSMAKVVR